MKKVEVVAAILRHEDKILCAQRALNKLEYISEKFEFPGGKIEAGESKKEALERELIEELEINPRINELYLTVQHKYPDFELIMHSFLCDCETKEVTLKEHISCEWLSIEELNKLDWAEADIPIVNRLVGNEG